ncbi:monovalent cation:proton antiporter-2 (CPA2) family protein [Sediminicurvatus halobius]|uniref:Cation:proton antiporter n=1 Tax=Sediminicurvatus halobius TaxID=2182432 RepID=A0A2U2N0M4_9GAMM|nr:monovalent cation:proton antiporter-2 (CPA2) family protein [Spiribacter halobius]PWG62514.1 cation:proton antiporter [Spiribacter halobius]UEX78609.1 monovalent cation:proton antiporter-2 (CPA2) family protein [Spiribacter halobius]
MDTTLLGQVVIFLAAAVLLVPLFTRIGLGAVLGYLAAGVLIGPSLLAIIDDADAVLRFSQVGIALLLFVIGLELQPTRLRVMRRPVFLLGGLQVLLTGSVLALAAAALGLAALPAAVVGVSLALSSTPLVLQLLAERDELQTAHGRHGFALLLFQDLAAIPALAVLPLLAARGDMARPPGELALEAAWALGAVLALVLGGRWVLRPAFRLAASARSREIFTAAALLVVIGSALLMDASGLSMALGAFLAGVLLADSEYRHEIEADIEPFKGLLLGLFFMAVGMTADLGLLRDAPGAVIGLAAGLLALKALTIALAARLYGLPGRDATDLGVLLAQGGEFGFVLLTAAAAEGVLGAGLVDRLVLAIALSMAATPLLFAASVRWLRPRLAARRRRRFDVPEEHAPEVIIAGFGRFGQIVGRVLRGLRIPYTVLEVNPEQVDLVRRYGNTAYYGDASRLDVLRSAGAEQARILVLAMDDVEASVRTAKLVHRHFPGLRVFARARDRHHSHLLTNAGVTWVIRETLLSSLELTRGVLAALGLPADQAERAVVTFREQDAQALERQRAVFRDEQELIQSVQAAARELEALYEADDALPDPGEALPGDRNGGDARTDRQ